jgi:hypothetical protein
MNTPIEIGTAIVVLPLGRTYEKVLLLSSACVHRTSRISRFDRMAFTAWHKPTKDGPDQGG